MKTRRPRRKRLTEGEIIAIRWLYRHKVRQVEIATLFGLTQTAISYVITRRTGWRVPEDATVTQAMEALST